MSDNEPQTSAPVDSPASTQSVSSIYVPQDPGNGSKAKEIGIGVGVPMFFITVGLVILICWFRRRRRRAVVREMVNDQEKAAGQKRHASDSDDSVGDLKASSKKRPETRQGASRQSTRQQEATSGHRGVWAERFNGVTPPKHNEVSLVERLTRSLSQSDGRRLQKLPPVDGVQRPKTAAPPQRLPLGRSASAARVGTVKQTRFDVPPSPTTSHHNRSISEPLQSMMRPNTAPAAKSTGTTTASQPQQPVWSPRSDSLPQFSAAKSIMPESSFSKPTKGSYALPAAFISDRDASTWCPKSPGYQVHTEMWRNQQQQWILEERRQIKEEYERLMKQREVEQQELQRSAVSRDGWRAAAAVAPAYSGGGGGGGGSGRHARHDREHGSQAQVGNRSPLLVRREPSDEELDQELGLSGFSRGYGYR